MNPPEAGERTAPDPRHDRMLETLLAAQATHAIRRRRRRRVTAAVAVISLMVGAVLVIRGVQTASLQPQESPPRVAEATTSRDRSPLDPSSGAIEVESTSIPRVGGAPPRWTMLPPPDPSIVDRLAITAMDGQRSRIAIIRAPGDRSTPMVNDDALLDHLHATGRTAGLVRIDGHAMLLANEHAPRNGS